MLALIRTAIINITVAILVVFAVLIMGTVTLGLAYDLLRAAI
jgi:hypothetical protein